MGSVEAESQVKIAHRESLSLVDQPQEESSARFKAILRRVTDSDEGYWNYDAIKSNSNPHAYFQYPAMMVPQMQSDIIKAIMEVFPGTKRTFDPFAGSGTILTESLKLGMSCIAVDINPMAVLLCKVKSAGFSAVTAELAFDRVLKRWREDSSEAVEIGYEKREKWFCERALIELSRVCRAIRRTKSLEMRRLLWVAFADAVRLTSNSRTSTYKLHIRDEADVARRTERVTELIEGAMRRVISLYTQNAAAGQGSARNGLRPKVKHADIYRLAGMVDNHDHTAPLRSLRRLPGFDLWVLPFLRSGSCHHSSCHASARVSSLFGWFPKRV